MMNETWYQDPYPGKSRKWLVIFSIIAYFVGETIIQGLTLFFLGSKQNIDSAMDVLLLLNSYPTIYIILDIIWIALFIWGLSACGLKFFSRQKVTSKFFFDVLIGVVLIFAFQWLIGGLTQWLYPEQVDSVNQTILMNSANQMANWKIFLCFCILPAISEEILTRGLIMRYFVPKHPFLGMVLAAAFFATLHASNLWIHWLGYYAMGMALAWTYYRTGRIEAAMTVHFINNFIATIPMYLS